MIRVVQARAVSFKVFDANFVLKFVVLGRNVEIVSATWQQTRRATKHFLTSANQRCVFLYIAKMCMLGRNIRVASRSAMMYTLNFKALIFFVRSLSLW